MLVEEEEVEEDFYFLGSKEGDFYSLGCKEETCLVRWDNAEQEQLLTVESKTKQQTIHTFELKS